MAKTKSQTNNDTSQFKLFVLEDKQSYDPDLFQESSSRGNGYVLWGKNNCTPNYLIDTVDNCPTLGSILKTSMDYTYGNGIIFNYDSHYFNKVNQYGESVEDVINKIISDRWIFGGYAIQVKYNQLGHIIEIAYVDFSQLRTDITGEWIYQHNKWSSAWGSNRARKIHCFDPQRGAEDGVQIYYYKGKHTRGVYPKPDYYSALSSAEVQIKIQRFHLSELENNFQASAMILVNGSTPDKEVQDQLEQKIKEKFTGDGNSGRFLVAFNSGDGESISVTRLSQDDFDKRYAALEESTTNCLYASLSAIPMLFGITVSTGFNEQEFNEAFNLYNRTRIQPKQGEIIHSFETIFYSGVLSFIPFTLTSKDEVDDSIPDYNNIPSEILGDLTTNERRQLVGYQELAESDADQSILADRIGVSGTDAMVTVITNDVLSESQKAGMLSVLFGLSQEDINKILNIQQV